MPVAIAPIDGQLRSMLREFLFDRGDKLAGLLVDGTFSVEVVVMFGDGEKALARNVASAQDIFKEGNYILFGFGTAEGDNKNGVVVHAGGLGFFLWINREKKWDNSSRECDFRSVPFWESGGCEGYPPPPHPLERLDWRGFRKKCLQNLEAVGVRGQNLENKRVAGISHPSLSTASALTMICLVCGVVKVRCHMRPVDRFEIHAILGEALKSRYRVLLTHPYIARLQHK
jgi:hypothetical protein